MATIRHELDPELEAITRPEDRERLYRDIHVLLANGKPLRTGVTCDDLIGALMIFCLVFATTLPAVLPFLFVRDPWPHAGSTPRLRMGPPPYCGLASQLAAF